MILDFPLFNKEIAIMQNLNFKVVNVMKYRINRKKTIS